MPLSKEIVKNIRKYAIKNAIDYGKAQPANVIGKAIRSVPKEQIPELKSEVEKIVNEVNSLSKTQLEKEYKTYEKEFDAQYEKKVEETSKPRMILEGATKGDFATRFAPEPSGYMHIGHASAAFLAQEFSKIYDGKLLLYFDDTNPEKETQEFVDSCKNDLQWLGIKFDREYYASDNMQSIYDCARKLLKSGKAYACECSLEEIKKDRFEGKECKHRNSKSEENLKKFELMLQNKYDDGKIIIRIKGDMKSQNTALRDPTIMRIKKQSHYRQGTKYVVWPTYDFNTPINDSMNGVTDAIRTKEYVLRGPLYDMVLDYLGMRKPRVHLHARIQIKGQPRSKRWIRKLISEGYVKGYDDPRLVTIVALRRRGIQPEAIREFVLGFGMSNADTVVDIAPLLFHNRKIIEKKAKHLYYVPAPVDIELDLEKPFKTSIKLHPSENLGTRDYTVTKKIYISGEDAADIKDKEVISLKDLFNLKIKKDDPLTGKVVSTKSEKRLQWVSDGNFIKCNILVPGEIVDEEGNFKKDSLRVNEGYIESYATNLKEKEIVQLERFGFCILDDKKKAQFILISK
jgi:glutamyl-tRNA synthetase